MTRVRQIDAGNDWTFGKGKNDYIKDRDQLKQSIKTRLQCFLGDCFFEVSAGLDWFSYLSSRDQTALRLAVASTILNTGGVTGLLQLSTSYVASTRSFSVTYRVATVYGTSTDAFEFNANTLVGA